jgi:DnaD/phage-associated family protein
MARGRFITNAIMDDKRINDLSCDTSRLAFTWLITLADCEGRVIGDPAVMRSKLFPRRTDVTTDDVEHYMAEWAAAGLIYWYHAKDDMWIWFPAFEKNQAGLRKDREAPSSIPDPESGTPVKTIYSGVTPELLPVKLIKSKVKNNNNSAPSSSLISVYMNNVNPSPTPFELEELSILQEKFPEDKITDAIRIAVEADARSIRYIKGVLNNKQAGKPKPSAINGNHINQLAKKERYG